MADPLSIAGSIAGLISAVKNAEKEVQDLKSQVASLTGTLHNLKLVAQDLEDDNTFCNSIRSVHINSCLSTLHKMKDKLDDLNYDDKDKFKDILRKLSWPYKSRETKELCEEVQGHRDNFNLAVSADSMTALLKCLAVQQQLSQDVKHVEAILQEREEVDTRIRLDERREKVLKFFLTVNPAPNLQTSVQLRYPTTGFWLNENELFSTWLRDSGSNIWLSGIPGAGKTVLSGLVIQNCLARSTSMRAVAYFFCDYKSAASQEPVNILSALASQIARQNEASFSLLEKYYGKLHPRERLEQRPDVAGLVSLLKEMTSTFEDVRIIVDGLDECGKNTNESGESLRQLISPNNGSISLAVLSRDEPEIREIFGKPLCEHIEIAAHAKDIDHFVRTEIEERIKKKRLGLRSANLKELVIEQLTSKAQGMFRWVACQLDYLCELKTDAARRKALYELPKTLNETYERILGRIEDHTAPLVQRTLCWIAYGSDLAKRPIDIESLLEAVSIEEGSSSLDPEAMTDEDSILRCCSSLIRKRGDILELAHFTVQEYLEGLSENSAMGKFRLDASSHSYLVKTSLEYLCFSDFDEPPPTTTEEFQTRD